MKNIIKLPSGINPIVPDPQTAEDIEAILEGLFGSRQSSVGDSQGFCKHDLRTSFLENEVVVYCTKCTYRIKGAQAWKAR